MSRSGSLMLYSSDTTGQLKGILRPLPEQAPSDDLPRFDFISRLWRFREGMIYLSPAPLYHAIPNLGVRLSIRAGGTAIIVERFNEEHYLELIQRHKATHSHLVPTMFSRVLKLPETIRAGYDLSSLEIAIHGAAPCPIPVKEQMIAWWGPIIHEYSGATEGLGSAASDTAVQGYNW
jgi:long-chain acyl-CoA synthetase